MWGKKNLSKDCHKEIHVCIIIYIYNRKLCSPSANTKIAALAANVADCLWFHSCFTFSDNSPTHPHTQTQWAKQSLDRFLNKRLNLGESTFPVCVSLRMSFLFVGHNLASVLFLEHLNCVALSPSGVNALKLFLKALKEHEIVMAVAHDESSSG